MSLKQQYQRFLLSNAFFQSQRELHADVDLFTDDEYDFSEQDNIQSEWVSYYYIPKLDMLHEREMRKALVQCHQVKYIEMDHQTQHMAIFHDGDVERVTDLLKQQLEHLDYQQTLSNFVPVTTTLKPVIKTTQILSWLSSIYIVLCLVTLCMAILASSLSLVAISLLVLMDALIYLVANNAIAIEPLLRNKLIHALAWFELLAATCLLVDLVHCYYNPHVPLASFMILQGVIILTASILSRYLIAKDYIRNRPLHWSHLVQNIDVTVATGLVVTGLLIQFTGKASIDLIMAMLVIFLIYLRVFNILILNKLALKP
ncbi:hypothetical protein IAE19_10920 [Acinetobacter sp. S40]|uniref:hypothetical protein n=1 Tax=unclassified Acinetobacter TaxID=196816 RepID=UPI00190979F5|nr:MULTISPECIES: hypothetical protein [unclassified Acinetobacter]MBJ9985946.1 hypothetical protein [Acinetobacter sp. S40]MBK0064449.1 hypothetical protein [Acinetobacter sp. S55]MBK0067147.1 hypothetical protein [Acinetobacter sp. S54]